MLLQFIHNLILNSCFHYILVRIAPNLINPIVQCSVELIKFVTGQANEICTEAKKDTLTGEHVKRALEMLEMPDLYAVAENRMAEFEQSNKEMNEKKKKLKQKNLSSNLEAWNPF